MKTGFLITALLLLSGSVSYAMEFKSPSRGELYTCAHAAVTRISTRSQQPAQCCDGKLQCPQFLATTTVVKPKHSNRL